MEEEEPEEEVEEPGEEEEEPAELGRQGTTVTRRRVVAFSREEGSNRCIWKEEQLEGVQRVGVLREVVGWTER